MSKTSICTWALAVIGLSLAAPRLALAAGTNA